jgi:hypothetical protein
MRQYLSCKSVNNFATCEAPATVALFDWRRQGDSDVASEVGLGTSSQSV